jgi:hypothetical protein
MENWNFEDIADRFIAIANGLGDIPASRSGAFSPRIGFAIATLSLAMEHLDGIAILTGTDRCGAAAALVRPLIECGTRGCWLGLVATDEEAEKFAADDKSTNRKKMLAGLAALPDEMVDHEAFSVPPELWNWLHGLTHGGFNQASHRLRDGRLSGIYRDEFVDGMLRQALGAGVWSTIVMSTLMGHEGARTKAALVIREHAWFPIAV